MTIIAEVMYANRESIAKAKLAALPRIGEYLHIDDHVFTVTAVDHFAVNAEPQYVSGVPVMKGEPFVLIIVKR